MRATSAGSLTLTTDSKPWPKPIGWVSSSKTHETDYPITTPEKHKIPHLYSLFSPLGEFIFPAAALRLKA